MQTPPKKSKAERDLETACGGRRVEALRNDGRVERVFVRQLPLRFAERFIELCIAGAEQRRLELCLGQSVEWEKHYHNKHPADRFTAAAQLQLLEAADELNFPSALSQIERRKNTMGALEPMLKRLYATQADMMKEAFKQLVDSALSSLKPPPPLAAPTTNSGATGASPASSLPSNSATSSTA